MFNLTRISENLYKDTNNNNVHKNDNLEIRYISHNSEVIVMSYSSDLVHKCLGRVMIRHNCEDSDSVYYTMPIGNLNNYKVFLDNLSRMKEEDIYNKFIEAARKSNYEYEAPVKAISINNTFTNREV